MASAISAIGHSQLAVRASRRTCWWNVSTYHIVRGPQVGGRRTRQKRIEAGGHRRREGSALRLQPLREFRGIEVVGPHQPPKVSEHQRAAERQQ